MKVETDKIETSDGLKLHVISWNVCIKAGAVQLAVEELCCE